jgi:hypothetical protein
MLLCSKYSTGTAIFGPRRDGKGSLDDDDTGCDVGGNLTKTILGTGVGSNVE